MIKSCFLLLSLSIGHSTGATHMPDKNYFEWAVLGAGPGGITAVGKLIDKEQHAIAWIDPEFNVGSLGKFYSQVPGNTKTKTVIEYFKSIKSFGFEAAQDQLLISHENPESCSQLSIFVEAYQWATKILRNHKQVTAIQSMCNKIKQTSTGLWELSLQGNKTVYAHSLILATGSMPKQIAYAADNKPELIDLEIALDKEKIKHAVTSTDTVIVFGNSHSGMLAVKNLHDCKIKKIIHVAKHPVRYAEFIGSSIKHDNTGLKGEVAAWAKNIYEQGLIKNLILTTPDTYAQYASQATKIIVAIGFEQIPIPLDGHTGPLEYDFSTGQIASRLFGLGIAFPARVFDQYAHEWEYDVGFSKFGRHISKNIDLWILEHTNTLNPRSHGHKNINTPL